MIAILFLAACSGVICYRKRKSIRSVIEMWQVFRKVVDPDGKKGCCRPFFSFLMLALLQSLTKKLTSPLPAPEMFNRTFLKISYTFRDRPYYYLLKIPRGVPPLGAITDEKGNDIYEVMSPYLGPNLDCHHIDLCPKDFGYQSISITTAYGDVVTFQEEQVISL